MNRFRHHINHAAEACGFQAGLAAASSCDKPLLLPPLPDAGHVCVTPAVAGEAVSALRMAGDGFVPRLDLRPDVFGERHALRRKAEASFAGPSALRHRGEAKAGLSLEGGFARMSSVRIEASTQARRAAFQQSYIGCRECRRPLSIEHQIERFCDACGAVTPVEIREGKEHD